MFRLPLYSHLQADPQKVLHRTKTLYTVPDLVLHVINIFCELKVNVISNVK